MTSTGRFTLPSEENFAEKTKELAELWGADAIRNSDGTHLDESVLALGKKIYSAYFPTRAHNEWITLHMDETPQVYLLTGRVLAEADIVDVPLMDGFFEEHCRALGLDPLGKGAFPLTGEFSQNLVAARLGGTVHSGKALDDAIPPRPPVMCAGCPHRGLFYTLNKNKCTVLGDIGCYTLGAVAPLSAMDMTLCMGGSISAIHGFNKARGGESEHKTVAVIGDSTFMHSGMTGLANIAYNQSNSTVIILDNSITGMTGHQQNPTTGFNIKGDPAGKIDLEALCRAMGFRRVRVVDPYDLKETDRAVKEELAADEPSVIISRRPCALLKYVKHKAPLKVNTDKCIGCKSCMKIGCPAISIRQGKAHVDNTLCVGCGVCEQLCGVKAFHSTKKEG